MSVAQVLQGVDEWVRDASSAEALDDVDRCDAEQLLLLHNETVTTMQQQHLQALRRGHEIMQVT